MVFEYFLHLDTHSLIKVHMVTEIILHVAQGERSILRRTSLGILRLIYVVPWMRVGIFARGSSFSKPEAA